MTERTSTAIKRIDVESVRNALAGRTAEPHPETESGQRAAVAAVLRDRPDGAEVLLIRRAAREGDPWSGHMALPGGRQQPDDRDLYHTALRETHEEVGIDLRSHGMLVGELDPIEAVARGRRVGLTIAPFVFALQGEPELYTNVEVEEALWAPLSPLARGELDTTVRYDIEGGASFDLPGWDVGGRIVWGLTYRMLKALFEALGR